MTEIGEESRKRILDAAEELFLERGYDKTTLNAIGERCGISYGSIPWHFGNKAGLLVAVVSRFVSVKVGTSPNHGEVLVTGLTGLRQLITNSSEWDDDPRFPLLYMLDAAIHDAPEADFSAVRAADERYRARIRDWLQRTLEANPHTHPFDPDSLAQVFISSVRGIAVLNRLYGDDFAVAPAREALFLTMASALGLDPDET